MSPWRPAGLLLILQLYRSHSFMYRPHGGLMWDPSCLTQQGRVYCFFMYEAFRATNETQYEHGFLAISEDGVHFRDHGIIDRELPGITWDKCQVRRVRDEGGQPMWVMNHGAIGNVINGTLTRAGGTGGPGCPPGTWQCLRFLSSRDLLTWEFMYSSAPDSRWYRVDEAHHADRWDHGYMLEDLEAGGFIAFPASSPTVERPPAPGVMRSPDGLNWTAYPPLDFRFGGVQPIPIEPGGVEQLSDGRYYILGGNPGPSNKSQCAYCGPCPTCPPRHQLGYSMWTLRSEGSDVLGPYAPDTGAYRLSGQGGWIPPAGTPPSAGVGLSAFARNYDRPGPDTLLVSGYITMPWTADLDVNERALDGVGGHVWLLPFRRPLIHRGHLRLAYWEGNEALKGGRLRVPPSVHLPPAGTHDAPGGSAYPQQRRTEAPEGTAPQVAFLDGSDEWNHSTGVILSGEMRLPAISGGQVGLVLETARGAQRDSTLLLFDVAPSGSHGRATWVKVCTGNGLDVTGCVVRDVTAHFKCGNATTCAPATAAGLAPNATRRFLLMLRLGIAELYLAEAPTSNRQDQRQDDHPPLLYVQTFAFGVYPVGRARLGLVANATRGGASLEGLELWSMDL